MSRFHLWRTVLWTCCLMLIWGWVHAHAQTPASSKALATGAAFAPDGRLWTVGLDAQGRLYTQSTPFPGPTLWSPPATVDTGGDAISADGENRPKIAFGPQGVAVITYTQPLPTPYAGMVRLLRSEDGGRTFGPPETVHDDRQPITHRFESVAFDGQGRLVVVWIDKRDRPAPGQRRVGAAIYQKTSVDGGRHFGPDQKVADASCECCRIALALDGQGRLHALWRHVFGTQTRDHAWALLSSQPASFQRVTFDQWDINACPHHGPGLARAQAHAHASEGFHMVWFGVREGVAGVRYARLDAHGMTVPNSLRTIPDAAAEHADVMAHGSTVAIVWRSYAKGVTSLMLWRSIDGGQHFELSTLDRQTGPNDHPRLAQSGERMAVVWRTSERTWVYGVEP